jgi:hypothetical protein
MAEEGEQGKGFKVHDRRRFSAETEASREDKGDYIQTTAGQESEKSDAGIQPHLAESLALPEINFSTFVISLSTQALMHLGEIPNPLDGKVERDIPVAKQMIDIISMLRDKTRSNLDQGEEKLMEDVLYDLRMRYVELVKKG